MLSGLAVLFVASSIFVRDFFSTVNLQGIDAGSFHGRGWFLTPRWSFLPGIRAILSGRSVQIGVRGCVAACHEPNGECDVGNRGGNWGPAR